MKRTVFFVAFSCLYSILTWGQTEKNDSVPQNRFVNRATMYGIGLTKILDSYLSPSEYKGMELRFLRENIRMTNIMDGKVSSQTIFQAHAAYTKNDADTGNEISTLFSWSYALHYHFHLSPNFKILAGPYGQANGGFIYNTRNSNNPAQGKAYINLGASAMAIYNFHINKKPLLLRYQLNIPLAGIMFSPEYQQSYYEIFTQGNWKHVIQLTSLHNQPSAFQMLTLDVPMLSSTMRFSYILDIHQSHVNQIKCHTYSHSFMIGLVKNILIIKNKDKQISRSPLLY